MKYKCFQIGEDYYNDDTWIYHQKCKEECPNQCTNSWQYWSGGWQVDNSIKISCGKILGLDMILVL